MAFRDEVGHDRLAGRLADHRKQFGEESEEKQLAVVVHENQPDGKSRPSEIGHQHRDLAVPAVGQHATDDPEDESREYSADQRHQDAEAGRSASPGDSGSQRETSEQADPVAQR